MCFSAGASFSAAAVLGAAGVFSLKKTTNKSQILFAATPMLFGLQQAVEGAIRITLHEGVNELLQTFTTYLFLFFAQMFWSTWIPLSILLLEKDKTHKNILKIVLFFGVLCSCLLGYRLITHPVHAEIKEHHIFYNIQSPHWIILLSSILYVVSTIAPFFLSKVKGVRTLGIALIISLLITKLFYEQYLVSVWCFFAAFLSIVIIFIVMALNKNQKVTSINYKLREDFD